MDPRTQKILFKLVNSQTIECVNGCISTGKEANVYHAPTETGDDYALKVFKTSILVFKDRDKYVSGERRYDDEKNYSKKTSFFLLQGYILNNLCVKKLEFFYLIL